MMFAYVPHDIRRGNQLWIKKAYYKVARRFDDTRWIIEVGSHITLISDADMRLTTEKGAIL